MPLVNETQRHAAADDDRLQAAFDASLRIGGGLADSLHESGHIGVGNIPPGRGCTGCALVCCQTQPPEDPHPQRIPPRQRIPPHVHVQVHPVHEARRVAREPPAQHHRVMHAQAREQQAGLRVEHVPREPDHVPVRRQAKAARQRGRVRPGEDQLIREIDRAVLVEIAQARVAPVPLEQQGVSERDRAGGVMVVMRPKNQTAVRGRGQHA